MTLIYTIYNYMSSIFTSYFFANVFELSARFLGRVLGLTLIFYLSAEHLAVVLIIIFLYFFLTFSIKQLVFLLTEKNKIDLISLFSPVNSNAILGSLLLFIFFFEIFGHYVQILFKESKPVVRIFFHTFTSTILLLFVKSIVKHLGYNCEFLSALINQSQYIYTVILGHINTDSFSSTIFVLISNFVQDSFEVFLICTHLIYVCVYNCLCPYELYLFSDATDSAWKLRDSLSNHTVCLSDKDSQDTPAESGNGFSTPPRPNSPVGGLEDFTTPPRNPQPLGEPPALNQPGAGSRAVDTSRNAAGQRIVDPRDVYRRHLRLAAEGWNRRNGTGLRDDIPLHIPEPDDPTSIALTTREPLGVYS